MREFVAYPGQVQVACELFAQRFRGFPEGVVNRIRGFEDVLVFECDRAAVWLFQTTSYAQRIPGAEVMTVDENRRVPEVIEPSRDTVHGSVNSADDARS
jgi:hypothetical protein